MTDEDIRKALAGQHWSIGRAGKRWVGPDILAKLDALPMKLEVLEGKLFWDDAERVRVLAALMEQFGLDQVLQVAQIAAARDAEAGGPPSLRDLKGRFGIPEQALAVRDMNPAIADPRRWMPIGRASADFGEELLGEGVGEIAEAADVAAENLADAMNSDSEVAAENSSASSRRTWNYWVMRFEHDEEVYFAIHEVYYAGERPTAYTVRPAIVGWYGDEGIDAAHATLARMHEALAQPALTPADFNEHLQDVDDETSDWDTMTPVGRERFWEPAANRYAFKTILELKRSRRGKVARSKAGRVAKLSQLKASIRKGAR